jgi:hypothetical protein
MSFFFKKFRILINATKISTKGDFRGSESPHSGQVGESNFGSFAEAIALRCCFQQIAVPVTTTPNRMEVQQVYIVTILTSATPSMPPPCIKY